jgi:hypothetical protein
MDCSSDALNGVEQYIVKDFDNLLHFLQDLFGQCSQLTEVRHCNNEKIEHKPH